MGENPPSGRAERQKTRIPLGFGSLYANVGDHIAHLYQKAEEGKTVLVPFLKAGLEAGDKCVCLISNGWKHQEFQDSLVAAGIDVAKARASGQLVLDEGSNDPQALQAMLSRTLAEIPGRFPLLRWAGVMSWALNKVSTLEKLMEWEAHRNTLENPAAVFLCQYEVAIFHGMAVMDALKTHPICIVNNVIHQNPYYEEPAAYLEALHRREPMVLA